MRLYTVLPAVIALLQREGRVTYRALQREFGFDIPLLDDVRHELVFKRLAMDEQGQGLVWTGGVYAPTPLAAPSPPTPTFTEPPGQTSTGASALPPMELASDTPLAVSLINSDSATVSPRKPPNEMASPEQTAATPTPLTPDSGLSNESDSTTTALESALADAIGGASVSNGAAAAAPSTYRVSEAERRQLTVMFCDLVGSTDLSGKLDPEDLREVVRAYQEAAAEVIQRYEGHIAQYLGDGLLIYFGFPVAHEDDAQRALHASLGIVEAITTRLNPRLEAEKGVQLTVRLGVHTGPVVVGEMGGGGRHEHLATGETVNIASRLEGVAAPNTVVISPVTAQLVQRSFVLEELGQHDLKGVAEPMMLYSVVGPREAEHDDHEGMLSGGFEALVGRDEEIGLLLRRWEQSKEGQGQVVLISGDAGLGKSSLVEGLRAHVRQEGYTRITFRCSPYTANSAMHPVIEHVQRVLGWQRGDTAETRLDKLEQTLQRTSLPVEETVPLLAALLSLMMPEDRYPVLTLSPQRQRQLTQDTLVAWMLEEAERQPVLAVWEDIHWSDPSTLELLGSFIDQIPTVSMLNVLAFRPEFVPPWPTQSHMTPITLNRLERTHIEALVKRLASGKMLPTEVVEHIVTKTDGVPLYVEELTKMLLESDLLEEQVDEYMLTGSLSSASIPATLQDSLMARLDSLPTVKEVAQLGSVLGREFDYEILQALNAIDEPTLQTGLSQLVAHELLYQRGRIPRAKFIFRHVLIRDAAYASLLRRTRQQHHQRIAQTLEERFSETAEIQPELLAHHYTEADLNEKAVVYWHQAGQRAIARSAHQEAINHLRKGLAVLMTLPDTPERVQHELQLHVALGSPLMATQGFTASEVRQVYARARELCQRMGDTPQSFPVLRGLWRSYQARGDLRTARELAEHCLVLAQHTQDPDHLVEACEVAGITFYHLGDLVTARPHFEHGIALYDAQRHHALTALYGEDPGVACLSRAAHILWMLGYPEQALQCNAEALTLACDLSHPFSVGYALTFTAQLYHYRREWQMVQEQSEAAIALSTEHGFPTWLTTNQMLLGGTLVAQGCHERGMAQGLEGMTANRALGRGGNLPYYLTLMAEAYGMVGQIDAGLAMLNEALSVAEETEVRYYEPEIHRLKGELLLQQSPTHQTEAEACYQNALEVSRHQQAKSLELRAATSLTRLWQSQNKRQEAYDLLAPVYEWFTEGFDTADLQEAKALLAELSA